MRMNRRQLLASLCASAAIGPAFAEAPERSLRPVARGTDLRKMSVRPADELLARASLGGSVGYIVRDAATGEVLEVLNPDMPLPPASTAKALTALYALGRLGPEHRFTTRLVAAGAVTDGTLQGDLVLAGGGDPMLDTDALTAMARELAATGITRVTGGLKVWTGALPLVPEVDREQPDHVGYNPTISGLNLNFNRVHFGWQRQGAGYDVTMDARSGSVTPGVQVARMRVVDRSMPIYTYERGPERDEWTVARAALGNAGARWLPVRFPGLYAGEVFEMLARAEGIAFGAPMGRAETDAGTVLVTHRSDRLEPILEDMLRYSNNMTAETVGLHASGATGNPVTSLAQSAERMNGWLRETYGLEDVALEDHSGLGDDSRVSARALTHAVFASQKEGELRPILKPFDMRDEVEFTVEAKTGTLNFVSALTGFLGGPNGRPLVFTILCANIERRDALSMDERERPEGGRAWNAAAKGLQRGLLKRWGTLYDA
ncbi:D-alanyl-D-alanine carboxypeptidase/D-alanyl-D-alanine-endopeptidase [Palleronia sediminis]|uniref:D-alanyl-D-alanine carboxypeptidase/D-alanyl-D-alanine-endopeptidase n=2 Tax=Palleronia sediminis TaxID=2547833 RepID=A0A4R6AEH9_9RHOB|nr:D-alanyl-D-alanine carboxypeptidase/D-alanyl-D-alanine-endopeptidase [Palleronia sediminis]